MKPELVALKQQLKELQDKVEALVAEAKATEIDVEPFPRLGVKYWFITTNGSVGTAYFEGDGFDLGAQSIGNIFRTKEEAEKEIEARKLIAELRRQPGARKFIPGQENWVVYLDTEAGYLLFESWEYSTLSPLQIYFETEGHLDAAIESIGKERIIAAIKWLAMGE